MKILLFTLCLATLTAVGAQETFTYKLKSKETIVVSGLGTDQDVAINPYKNEDCMAIIKNLGKRDFEIRTINKNEKTSITKIIPQETKRIFIEVGSALYLDANKATKASVSYQRMQ